MRDIGKRIHRYRLGRYAPPPDPVRRRLRWAWLLAGLWLVWVGVISDHSLYRIWRLSLENSASRQELARAEREIARLDIESKDPVARAHRDEAALRENGMARPHEIIYRENASPHDSTR